MSSLKTELKAKAKINLFFQINNKREDGYHLIESLIVFADDIYDHITISQANEHSTIVVSGEFSESLRGEKNNLINKALEAFSGDFSYQCQLIKDIPIGAGLGGGSSDAAVVAKFVNIQQTDINKQLTAIGADLPICYLQSPAFCSGIGEVIEPVINMPKLYLLLVNPNKTLLTKNVFKNNKQINTQKITNKTLDFSNDYNKIIEFLAELKNDLTEAAVALMPEIKDILDLLNSQDGCEISRMSGSGPTCFGVFKSLNQVKNAQSNILNFLPNHWVKITKI